MSGVSWDCACHDAGGSQRYARVAGQVAPEECGQTHWGLGNVFWVKMDEFWGLPRTECET